MGWTSFLLLLCLIGTGISQRAGRRRGRFPAGKPEVVDFNCPEDFGYYPHASECSLYYVCVFGGALLESCSGGLVYSHELQTCDWPRNVQCTLSGAGTGVSTVRVTDPRTSNTAPLRAATESLTPSVSNFFQQDSRFGFDNSFSSSQNFQSSSKGSNNRPRSASPSSAFRPITFSPPRTENRRPPTPKPTPSSNPSRFSIALGSTTQAPPATVPAVLDPFYGDSFNYTDADYLYYYDEFVYDDYIDVAPATTAKPTVQAESFDRIRVPVQQEQSHQVRISPRNRGGARVSSPSTSSSSFASHTSVSPSSALRSSQVRQSARQTSSSQTSSQRGSTSSSSRPTSSSAFPSSSFLSSSPAATSRRVSSSTPSRTSGQTPKSSPTQGPPRPAGSIPQRSTRPTLKPVSQVAPSAARPNDIWRFPPKRPQSLYPRPPVDVKATKCDSKKCLLPDCFCGGKDIPGGIAPQEVPQMVLLTFDDSVNDLNKELYVELFERGRKNPNGCGITATFYVSHEWTDYSQVQNLYADGHEMASHTIQHSFGEQFSTRRWAREVAGQREILSAYGGVKMEDVRGMRAPFLAIGGNKMFKMLYDQNFTYDSSMPVYENNPPSYPYTLDYRMFHDCMIPPCPTKAYPGVWEVPMVMWQDLTGGRCSMGDACTTPSDAEGVYKMIIKNFERHYTTNRAPFGLYYHAAWFTKPHHKEGFLAFLDTITAMDDVYLVTTNTALEWTRNPVPLSQARNYPPFQCDYKDRPPKCNKPKVCNVWHNGGVRYMRTCQQCPETYPWTGRTGVQSPLNEV